MSASAHTSDLAKPTANIVVPSGDDFAIDVGLYARFLAETNGVMTLSGAIKSDQWLPVNLALIDGARADPNGNYSAPFNKGPPTWVFFKIENQTDKRRKIILDTQRPDLRNMVIYTIGANGDSKIVLEFDFRDPFEPREIKHTELATKLYLEPHTTSRIYIRYVRSASEPMPLKLFGTAAYDKKIRHKSVWTASFLSVLGTIILITLLGLPALRWRIALSYVFYVSMVILWYIGVTGHFFSLLMPNFPIIAFRAVEVFAALMFAGFLNMGRVLFGYNETNPLYNKILVSAIFANLIFALILLLIDIYEYSLLAHAVSLLSAISVILYVSNAVIAVRNKRDGALAMLIGSLSLLAAFLIYRYVTIAVNAGELVFPIGRAILIPPISFIEISCFALAMIQGQIGIRRQRDQALRSEFKAVEKQLRLSSALRSAEASYQTAHRQAKRRQERLSSVSHDILQPLTSLRAMLGNAKRMDTSRARKMRDALDYLETLAQDTLTSSAPRGDEDTETHYETQYETFKVTAVLDNIFAMFEAEAKTKGLDFQYHADALSISTKPIELMRIISNIVSNAIKHTEEGIVNLTCEEQDGKVHISVQDTGKGMTKSEIKTYLKAYSKGEKSKGTGLGLYQAKASCEALGHIFKIVSHPKTGTVISVII